MVAEYQQEDGEILTFGVGQPAGLIAAATGRLVRVYHGQHYRLAFKRENRGGDAVTGRKFGQLPTAYEGDAKADVEATERVARMQELARRMGTTADDVFVKERYRAEQLGGPYPHTHQMPLATYRVTAHLLYAHGISTEGEGLFTLDAKQRRHREDHAFQHARETEKHRQQDPGFEPPKESDWREQTVHEVGDLP